MTSSFLKLPSRNTLAVAGLQLAILIAIAPSREQPFSFAKLAVLALGALLLAALSFSNKREAGLAVRAASALGIGWIACAAISGWLNPVSSPRALILDGAAALLLLAMVQLRFDRLHFLRCLSGLGALHASVVLLQAAHLDPLRWLGLVARPSGARMETYGLLGNPDFAAAWLGATLAVTAGLAMNRKNRWLWASALLQLAAIACAHSLASLLALGAASLVLAWSSRAKLARVAMAALPAMLLLALAAADRDPARVLRGRIYLAELGAAQLPAAPIFGQGPGSVEALFPAWEANALESLSEPQRAQVLPFAGAQDHLHQDLLERAVEQGFIGAAIFLALLALGFGSALRASRREPAMPGCAAAIASLAARGLVDFPAERPAELALLVALIACAARARDDASPRATRPLQAELQDREVAARPGVRPHPEVGSIQLR